jgi:hypothetical protein
MASWSAPAHVGLKAGKSCLFSPAARWLHGWPATAAGSRLTAMSHRFVSTGDMASGVFCFFIGVHTFASVIFDFRLSNLRFGLMIVALWAFVYVLAIAGVAIHPQDYFVRAVSWCWVNSKYSKLRLWLHYFWIFTFEFGTVLIYVAMFAALQYRIRTSYYKSPEQVKQARSAMKLMVVYPIIYVICTLPLATLRMVSMTSGLQHRVAYGWFCFAGAMITSNGWLDVFLYSMTRRILLFSDEPPPDTYGIETFQFPFGGGGPKRFGTKTTCEFSGSNRKPTLAERMLRREFSGTDGLRKNKTSNTHSFASTDQLFSGYWSPSSPAHAKSKQSRLWSVDGNSLNVKTETTVEVRSEPLVELEDMREMHAMRDAMDRVRPPSGSGAEEDELEFVSKPAGW